MRKLKRAKTNLAPALAVLFCAAFFSAARAQSDPRNGSSPQSASDHGGSGVLPAVLIQAEENKPLTLDKPPLGFQIKQDQPVQTLLEREDRQVMNRLPSEIIRSNIFSPELSVSSRSVVPDSAWIILTWRGEPAHVFHPQATASQIPDLPKADRKIRRDSHWSLEVADDSGKIFKRFQGDGWPPERLVFDGRGENGDWIQAGRIYTGVLKEQIGSGRLYTGYGRAFKLAGLALQKPDGFLISLDGALLFSKKQAAPQLAFFGRDLLDEAAGVIERYAPGYSLDLRLYSGRADADWAGAAAGLCARLLGRRLLKSPPAVKTESFASTPNMQERLDILALNH